MTSKVDLKVVIIGMATVGKTCLLERYLHDRYVETHAPTVGAGFGAKKIAVGTQSVLMGLWDTAGSERYESMTKSYYRGANAAVICYDLKNGLSYAKMRFWITQLMEHEPDCQIYIAGLKLDLIERPSDRCVPEEEINALVRSARIADKFECSAKTGAGVEALFSEIARRHLARKREADQNRDLVNIHRSPQTSDPSEEGTPSRLGGCCGKSG